MMICWISDLVNLICYKSTGKGRRPASFHLSFVQFLFINIYFDNFSTKLSASN